MKNFRQIIFPLFFVVLSLTAIKAQEDELKLEILNGHSGGGVLSVVVSSDGKFALTGSTDETALLWDLKTGKQLRRFSGFHEDAVSCVQFSKDGRFVLTASFDSTAQLWETATGKRVHGFGENRNGLLIKHSGKILSCAVSADMKLVATAGEDKTARIWDFQTGKQLFELRFAGQVNSIAFSPDSQLLLTGGEDKIARLYSTETGKEEKQFVGHTREITSVAYSPDGKQILTGSKDKSVRLWNAEKANEIKTFEHYGEILIVAFTPDGNNVITSQTFVGTKIWNIKTGEQIIDIRQVFLALAQSENVLLIREKDDKVISVFNISEGKQIQKLEGKSERVNGVSVSPNSNYVLTTSNIETSGLWNLTSEQIYRFSTVEKYFRLGWEIVAADFSPNGKAFVVAGSLGMYTLFDLDNVRPSTASIVFHGKLFSVVFSPDSRFLLAGYETHTYLNEIVSDSERIGVGYKNSFQHFSWREGFPPLDNIHLAISPNGKVAATTDGHITFLWIIETGGVKHVITDFSAPVWSVAFSPDGRTIATASGTAAPDTDNRVTLFDVETGRKIRRFGGEVERGIWKAKIAGLKSVTFSPDGQYLLGGDYDGKSYLWEISTGRQIRQFVGHTAEVNSVKFAKDANGNLLIVSGSSDSTTRIWNASTGEEICALVTFRDGNWAVVQTKTGRYDAPNGGEIDGIQWVYGNETIELNQLKDIYYTPKLLPRLLGYNKEPLAKVPDLKNLKLFPKILEQTLDEKNVRLTVRLQNRGGGIGPVRIAVNGKSVTEDARDERLKANPFVENATVVFDLKGSAFVSGKENKIEVFTNNYDTETKKGYISSRGSVSLYTVKQTAEVKPPTLYAIIGGVSDYAGSNIDLKFASKDAEDMATAVSLGAKRLFGTDKIKMTVLSTSGLAGMVLPTKENFKKAFEDVAKNAQPDDILFIYLSGHGVSLGLNTDTYFYLTQEAQSASKEALNNPDVRDATAISSTELTEWLTMREWVVGEKGIKAMKQVMVLDTCASGVAQEQFNLIAKKELSSDQVRAIERLKDRTGFFVLMGSTADAPSYEASRYGQGLLTYALLQGMRGAALRDGEFIDVQKLFQYAADEVPKLAQNVGGIQRPIISTPFGGVSFDVGQLKTDDRKSVPIATIKPILLRPRFSTGEEGDDTLGLIEGLSKKLEEASYANTRSGERAEASIVYIREGDLPGGIRVTGTYTIEDGTVKIKAFLRRDGKTIAALPEISATKEKVLDELLNAVHSQLSKINDKYR